MGLGPADTALGRRSAQLPGLGVRVSALAWPGLIVGLLLIGLLLAWADSTAFHAAFPVFPEPPLRPGRAFGQNAAAPPPDAIQGLRVGPKVAFVLGTRGLFQFGWFVSVALALVVLCIVALLLFPARIRNAVDRLEAPGGLPTALTAGVATTLLAAGATFLFRNSFFFLALVPVVWIMAAACLVFGLASLALATGRRLTRFLGAAHPILLALGGVLIICDIALVPYLGWALLGAALLAAFGLAAATRAGSAGGWSLDELNW